jgi:hypothetical protein
VATVEQVKSKIQGFLQKHGSVTIDNDGDFAYEWGSSAVFIRVLDWGDGDVLVNVYAIVAGQVPITDELCADLILERSMVVGAWSINRDSSNPKVGDITFSIRLFGNDLDESEIIKAIALTGEVADDQDDQIVARFGGKRMADI